MHLQVAQHLPDGYAGIHVFSRARVQQTAMLTPTFNAIMNDYSLRSSMTLDDQDCDGVCTTVVKVRSSKPKSRRDTESES